MKKHLKLSLTAVALIALAFALTGCGCNNTTEPTETNNETEIIGSTIRFGEMEWRVLDVEGNRKLILSEYLLEPQAYQPRESVPTWETSSINAWLNGEFYNSFTNEQREKISETEYGKVFILDLHQIADYFFGIEFDDDGVWWQLGGTLMRTAYLPIAGYETVPWAWWVRHSEESPDTVTHITAGGDVHIANDLRDLDTYPAVRPAMWVYITTKSVI